MFYHRLCWILPFVYFYLSYFSAPFATALSLYRTALTLALFFHTFALPNFRNSNKKGDETNENAADQVRTGEGYLEFYGTSKGCRNMSNCLLLMRMRNLPYISGGWLHLA
jgi:hypothetical protein